MNKSYIQFRLYYINLKKVMLKIKYKEFIFLKFSYYLNRQRGLHNQQAFLQF